MTDYVNALAELEGAMAQRQLSLDGRFVAGGAAISEPALPALGTPERDRLEVRHAEMVAGLLRCADPLSWTVF